MGKVPFNREHPFNALPDLPPPADLETPEIFRATIQANRLLAERRRHDQDQNGRFRAFYQRSRTIFIRSAHQVSFNTLSIWSHTSRSKIRPKRKSELPWAMSTPKNFFSYPYIKISVLEEHGIAKRQTASNYLKNWTNWMALRSKSVERSLLHQYQADRDIVKISQPFMYISWTWDLYRVDFFKKFRHDIHSCRFSTRLSGCDYLPPKAAKDFYTTPCLWDTPLTA